MKKICLLYLIIFSIANVFSQPGTKKVEPNANVKMRKVTHQIEDDLVLVPGGRFNVGCGNTYSSPCFDFEKRNDSGSVSLDSFYIGKYDITQEEWEAVMDTNPSYFKNCPKCPVESVSWEDVQVFIKKLNQLTGLHYRLPTSTEWEFAARGGNKSHGNYFGGNNNDVAWNSLTEEGWQCTMGTKWAHSGNLGDAPLQNLSWDDARKFIDTLNARGQHYRLPSQAEWNKMMSESNKGYKYAGSNNLNDVAWYYGNSDYATHIVGLKKPNELGLYDMNGNVWQWCSDWWELDNEDWSYHAPPDLASVNPQGPVSGHKRVVRGEPWWMDEDVFRVTMLFGYAPDYHFNDTGFRLVKYK